eukprot:TRINITY_DN17746_c0_g1_i3.p1 TRINITY_DN17746_c0_g1~~TRINITY_DN17746_c0_g1_i3.p1  ORF type:complete len:736 (-),score=177.70 TRINITY_DN17746_c0_g1_i3:82-2289(-)
MCAAVAVHFGSPYLLTSPFLYQLLALKAAMMVFAWRKPPSSTVSSWLLGRMFDVAEGLVAVFFFLAVQKAAAPFATADTHIYEILCTKVATFNDMLPTVAQLPASRLPACSEPSFNARLYLIMGVFNVLEKNSLDTYSATTASPAAALAFVFIVCRCVLSSLGFGRPTAAKPGSKAAEGAQQAVATKASTASNASSSSLRKRKGGSGAAPDAPASSKGDDKSTMAASSAKAPTGADNEEALEEAALLWFAVQFVLFFILGAFINRLRVAFGPPLMVLAAVAFGPRLFPAQGLLARHRGVIVAILTMLHGGHGLYLLGLLPCLGEKGGICNHLDDKSSNDGDLADLSDWMNRRLDPSLSVLASMNLAGSLRLFTNAPLIVHPQFESENLRKRVQQGYELYHCGSESGFADTMRSLKAQIVIFEYFRCFFTPYTLDDRKKNCVKGKHAPEEQLCLKLHAGSEHFKLLFTNGGYAVFQLNNNASSVAKRLKADEVSSLLVAPTTWQDHVERCAQEQGADCGPRLMETAAAWLQSMKRGNVAQTIRNLAIKRFPDDGYVNYYMARYLDYDAQQADRALPYYRRAVEKLPNNAIVLKEYLMFLEVALKDSSAVLKFIKDRQKDKGDSLALLNLSGPAAANLLCEAAASAKQAGLEAIADKLWEPALRGAPLSDCMKNNWPIMYPKGKQGKQASFDDAHDKWTKIRLMFSGGVNHQVTPHNSPGIRFTGDRTFLTNPLKPS